MRARRLILPLACVAMLAAACGGKESGVTSTNSKKSTSTIAVEDTTSDSVEVTPDATAAPTVDPFKFTECADGVDCGYLDVPIDYENPDAGSFKIFTAVHRATNPDERIGSLLINPGGPGFGGSDFAIYADGQFGERLLRVFDIVAWDPRGTGDSEPSINCIEDYDRYFAAMDITPETPAERQQIIDLAQEFQGLCVNNNDKILQFVGTNNAARDMDSIRAALGEDTISYLGFSYGSELGATWATLFPETVRAAVLDGAVDPDASFEEGGLQQAGGFELAVTSFLKDCSANSDCPFYSAGNAEAAFDALMLRLDASPVPSLPGRPPVNYAVALNAVAEAMYSNSSWPTLAQGLLDAQNGDGAGLLALYDQYFVRGEDGQYDNSLEAFQTISCMDTPERPTIAEEDAIATKYNQVAPRFAPGTTGGYMCSFYPEANDPRIELTGEGAGPIVVVGTTGDPATPIEGTRKMAAALEDGVLVVVEGDQHTGYGLNQCINDVVEKYLVKLTVPDDNTQC